LNKKFIEKSKYQFTLILKMFIIFCLKLFRLCFER